MAVENSMQSVNRTIQILKAFNKEEKELSLAKLHQKLGISKSSIQRILNTLVNHGFIEKNEEKKTYKLGMEIYFLGKIVEENSHLLNVAKSYLSNLRDQWEENVYLNVIENNERKCIAFKESRQALMTISYYGEKSPLFAGASAKVLLAFLSPKEKRDYIENIHLHQITDSTISNKQDLIKELNDIQKRGFAISYGERTSGAFAISAPIFANGELLASISLSAPAMRVDEPKINAYRDSIVKAAEEISNQLTF